MQPTTTPQRPNTPGVVVSILKRPTPANRNADGSSKRQRGDQNSKEPDAQTKADDAPRMRATDELAREMGVWEEERTTLAPPVRLLALLRQNAKQPLLDENLNWLAQFADAAKDAALRNRSEFVRKDSNDSKFFTLACMDLMTCTLGMEDGPDDDLTDDAPATRGKQAKGKETSNLEVPASSWRVATFLRNVARLGLAVMGAKAASIAARPCPLGKAVCTFVQRYSGAGDESPLGGSFLAESLPLSGLTLPCLLGRMRMAWQLRPGDWLRLLTLLEREVCSTLWQTNRSRERARGSSLERDLQPFAMTLLAVSAVTRADLPDQHMALELARLVVRFCSFSMQQFPELWSVPELSLQPFLATFAGNPTDESETKQAIATRCLQRAAKAFDFARVLKRYREDRKSDAVARSQPLLEDEDYDSVGSECPRRVAAQAFVELVERATKSSQEERNPDETQRDTDASSIVELASLSALRCVGSPAAYMLASRNLFLPSDGTLEECAGSPADHGSDAKRLSFFARAATCAVLRPLSFGRRLKEFRYRDGFDPELVRYAFASLRPIGVEENAQDLALWRELAEVLLLRLSSRLPIHNTWLSPVPHPTESVLKEGRNEESILADVLDYEWWSENPRRRNALCAAMGSLPFKDIDRYLVPAFCPVNDDTPGPDPTSVQLGVAFYAISESLDEDGEATLLMDSFLRAFVPGWRGSTGKTKPGAQEFERVLDQLLETMTSKEGPLANDRSRSLDAYGWLAEEAELRHPGETPRPPSLNARPLFFASAFSNWAWANCFSEATRLASKVWFVAVLLSIRTDPDGTGRDGHAVVPAWQADCSGSAIGQCGETGWRLWEELTRVLETSGAPKGSMSGSCETAAFAVFRRECLYYPGSAVDVGKLTERHLSDPPFPFVGTFASECCGNSPGALATPVGKDVVDLLAASLLRAYPAQTWYCSAWLQRSQLILALDSCSDEALHKLLKLVRRHAATPFAGMYRRNCKWLLEKQAVPFRMAVHLEEVFRSRIASQQTLCARSESNLRKAREFLWIGAGAQRQTSCDDPHFAPPSPPKLLNYDAAVDYPFQLEGAQLSCGACLEEFEDGQLLVAYTCGHPVHLKCAFETTGEECPVRCEGTFHPAASPVRQFVSDAGSPKSALQ